MNKPIFYIEKYNYLSTDNLINVNDLSPIVRRRLSVLDKVAMTVLNKTSLGEGVESIVFSSKTGELSRLVDIISQIRKNNEVSPNKFSASVHNYLLGFFTSLYKTNIPYMSISSCENSLSAGLIQSIATDSNKVLYCYADVSEQNIEGVSCNISKLPINNSIKCRWSKDVIKDGNFNAEFARFIEFLQGKTNTFNSAFGTFERIEE